jgi:hypothetical protein
MLADRHNGPQAPKDGGQVPSFDGGTSRVDPGNINPRRNLQQHLAHAFTIILKLAVQELASMPSLE